MYSGRDPVTGCMGAVLRRFLCVKLHLHSSTGRSKEHRDGHFGVEMEGKKPNSTPGVVARLMGLDTTPPVITGRSRSMSAIGGDSQVMVPDGVSLNGLKKCSSFKEIPTFLREENEDFLLLSFGGDDGEKEAEEREVKVVACLLELDEEFGDGRDGRRVKIARRMDEKKQIGSSSAKVISRNQKKLIGSERRPDSELSSENSSPVSVLDRALEAKDEYFSIDLQQQEEESPFSGHILQISRFRQRNFEMGKCCSTNADGDQEEEEEPSQRNPRRKLGIHMNTPPDVNTSLISDREQRRPTSLIRQGSSSSRRSTRRAAELWGEICRFAVEDLKETTNWVFGNRNNIRQFEDLNVSIEINILDFLIQDLAEELLFQ